MPGKIFYLPNNVQMHTKSRNHLQYGLRCITCLVLWAINLAPSYAQNSQPANFYIGLRAMPQACFLLNPDDTKEKNGLSPQLSWGYAGSLIVGQDVSKHFGFETGFLYSMQNQKYKVEIDTLNQNATLSKTYIKFPFILYYHTSREKKVNFVVGAGPQLALLTNAQYSIEGQEATDKVAYSEHLTYRDLYNPTDIALAGIVGIDVQLGTKLRANAQLRTDFSVVDAEDRTLKPPKRATSNWLTTGFSIGLNYILGEVKTE